MSSPFPRKRHRLAAVVACLFPALGLAGAAHAQTPVWTEDRKIVANDGEPGDQFGISVALDGNTALIGGGQKGSGPFVDDGPGF